MRWMPISALFCYAVPPVKCKSCHRSRLYMKTDTSHCGTWVNTARTCVIDIPAPLCCCFCKPHERGRSVHCTDGAGVLVLFCATEKAEMSGFIYSGCKLIRVSQQCTRNCAKSVSNRLRRKYSSPYYQIDTNENFNILATKLYIFTYV